MSVEKGRFLRNALLLGGATAVLNLSAIFVHDQVHLEPIGSEPAHSMEWNPKIAIASTNAFTIGTNLNEVDYPTITTIKQNEMFEARCQASHALKKGQETVREFIPDQEVKPNKKGYIVRGADDFYVQISSEQFKNPIVKTSLTIDGKTQYFRNLSGEQLSDNYANAYSLNLFNARNFDVGPHSAICEFTTANNQVIAKSGVFTIVP